MCRHPQDAPSLRLPLLRCPEACSPPADCMKSVWLEKLRCRLEARRPFQNIGRNRGQGGLDFHVRARASYGLRVGPPKLPCLEMGVDAACVTVNEIHLGKLPDTADQESHVVFRSHRRLVRVDLLRALCIDVDSPVSLQIEHTL